jgi:DNA-binding MarR family transcriptional regulator
MLKEDRSNQKLVEHLFFLFRSLHRGADAQAIKGGFTLPQRIVMGQLVRNGDLSVKELSQKVGLSHSTVSGIVDRLERKGLAMRIQDPQDRRINKVTITDLAKKHFNNMLPQQMFSGIVDAFNQATAVEQVKILDGLTTLRQLLDKGE